MNTVADGQSIARRWHWRERAHAWDVHQRELLALSERNTRVALHSRRVERMEDYLDAVCEVLDAANMTAADEQLAREWLPQMRVFLRDLLVAERQEFERGDYEKGDPDSSLVITADDLRAAQRALESEAQHSQAPAECGSASGHALRTATIIPGGPHAVGLYRPGQRLDAGPGGAAGRALGDRAQVPAPAGRHAAQVCRQRCAASAGWGGRSNCCTWRCMPRRRGSNSPTAWPTATG